MRNRRTNDNHGPALRNARRLRGVAAALLLLLGGVAGASAQELFELRGTVTDAASGEPVVRATVQLQGTKLGAYTDLKGVYTVRKIPKGTYTVMVSMIGYGTKEISNIVIDGRDDRVDVVLKDSALETGGVTKTARRTTGTEEALLSARRSATTINDGISYAQMRRLPDATSADALARVTGMSIVGNKFAFVRGTSERYSSTQLNGVSVASTEPDKRAFSFDLVPSNLLENTIVSKTFTPDLPGDFSGGLVQLNTTDFPDRSTARLSVSGSWADGTTFQDLMLGPRGGNDFLGSDDGLRALPASIPAEKLTTTKYKPEELAEYTRAFANSYRRTPVAAAPNWNFLLSYGGRTTLLDNDFGVLASLSYRNGYQFTPIVRSDSTRFHYRGVDNTYSVLWGGMLNLSYKLSDLHSISIKNVYSRSAEDQYTFLDGLDEYSGILKRSYGFHYVERGIYSGQITGEHVIPDASNLRVQWRGFGSVGDRNEPDYRRLQYGQYDPSDTSLPYIALIPTAAPNGLSAGRLFTELNDETFGFGTDVTLPLTFVKVKVGGLVENKRRDFTARLFAYVLSNEAQGLLYADVDTIFDPSHAGANALRIEETTNPSDKYDAASHLRAGYAMFELPIEITEDQSVRVVAGARLESANRIINTADIRPINIDTTDVDILPSINVVYQPIELLNVRLAFSRTVARPEFREYAKFAFYDFTTEALVYGNPALQRTLITNYDFRVELFPDVGELLALSVFHKSFENAIEEVALVGDSPERTWANAEKATNTGVEIELRKSLGFIAEALQGLAISVNYTWLDSRVDVAGSEFTAAKAGRKLQGQSPYVINAGIYFTDENLGTSATLAYNRFGERITQVSRTAQPDFIEQPRDQIDFSITQSLFENYELKLAIRDILAQDQVFNQGDRPARINGKQTSASLSFAVRF